MLVGCSLKFITLLAGVHYLVGHGVNIQVSLFGPLLPKVGVIDVDVRPVLRHVKTGLHTKRSH